ncbi:putative lipid II flippase FtsW [Naumannella sp. ID2617S]|nr:putative lipid II flippase FtsW [Naumannella sp. ID2617S]
MIRSLLNTPLASLYLVLVSAGLLIALGMMMVLSASSVYAYVNTDDSYYFVKRQMMFCGLGLVFAVVLARSSVRRLRSLSWVGLFLAVGLLVLTYLPGLHANVNGNQNWLSIGDQRIGQPSEFAKIAMILWGADILARKERLLDQPKHLLVPFLPVSLLLILLVVFQGDMGTAMIMIGILAGILWAVGTPLRILVAMAGLAAAATAVMTISRPSRLRRLMAFLNPTHDVQGTNMQATVGVFALATGGWWGVGLGASRQKWGSLPEAHTDYIFAVIGEELGLFGALAVLALLLVLGYAGIRIALRSDELFTRLLATGITTWFMFQSLVNLAVVLRMLPVLGVPLPMLSYGGSALTANIMALGLLIACARNEPQARELLATRRRRPQPRMTTVVGSRRG